MFNNDTSDWPCYWYMWKSKSRNGATSSPSNAGSSYKDFWHQWKAAKKSGNWSVFDELVAEFKAMSDGERRIRIGRKYRRHERYYEDLFGRSDEPDAEEEREPHEESEPQQEKRWGDPGFWEDFGRQYREAEEREQGRSHSAGHRTGTGSAHHRNLGVRPGATREEIRSAYRALAMQHHPDHGGSVEKMREINAAYEALCG